MKQLLKRSIAGIVPPRSPHGVRVLLYHAVDQPDAADRIGLRVAPDAFRAQMASLRARGVEVVALGALLSSAHASSGRPQVAITFDDGYRSQIWAASVLREFTFPATFFVVPRYLDGIRQPGGYWEAWEHMNWDELGALAAQGFEVGAHSSSHVDLPRCSGEGLRHETEDVKATIERRLGAAVRSFSYPFGRHNARVRQAVAEAGYQLACTSRYGINRAGVAPYAVRRTEVSAADRLRDFRQKLDGRYDWLTLW